MNIYSLMKIYFKFGSAQALWNIAATSIKTGSSMKTVLFLTDGLTWVIDWFRYAQMVLGVYWDNGISIVCYFISLDL